jgi:hypothetical protein
MEALYLVDENENFPCKMRYTNVKENNKFSPTKEKLICTTQFIIPTEKIRGNQSRSTEKDFIYFEVQIENCTKPTLEFAIGLSPKEIFNEELFVGWQMNSIGFHLDNGGFYDNTGTGDPKIPEYIGYKGVTVGICWNLKSGEIFFTRNGEIMKNKNEKIEFKRKDPFKKLFPTISCKNDVGIVYSVNVGSNVVRTPFLFEDFNILKFNLEDVNDKLSDVLFFF